MATRHHAILIEEPLFGGASALALAVAAEVFGIPGSQAPLHPDLVFLPSDGKLITVETMRETTAAFGLSPQGERRVVIWEDIGRMNTNSANAFLKSLEEPDSKTLFLLIASKKELLLPTITSRVIDVPIELAALRPVTEELLKDAPHLLEASMGRPLLAAALLQEEGKKDRPLTELLQECTTMAGQLLSDQPRDQLAAYGAVMALKEQEKKLTLPIPVRPLHLFCFLVEGTIEKMLSSTMMTGLSPRAHDMASRILRFRQDIDQNASTKLAALDLVFGTNS